MVAVLQMGYWMPLFHKVVGIFRVFLKCSQWSYKTTRFLPCQKQLCSQWLVSVHIYLHANEHCSPHLSFLWKWSSLSFNFLTKPALNCPSFRKQSRVKWFVQPGIIEFSESEVMCGQAWWPILRICALHSTHPSAHTHTMNTHPEQWAAILLRHLGSSWGFGGCLAQGSRGIEGGREHWLFTPKSNWLDNWDFLGGD